MPCRRGGWPGSGCPRWGAGGGTGRGSPWPRPGGRFARLRLARVGRRVGEVVVDLLARAVVVARLVLRERWVGRTAGADLARLDDRPGGTLAGGEEVVLVARGVVQAVVVLVDL